MRQPRLKADPLLPAACYHCVSRVVNRDFVLGEEEREHFVLTLRRYERFCGVRVVTFCVLSNHFHLLVEVPRRPEGAFEGVAGDGELLERLAGLELPLGVNEVRQMLERFRAGGHHEAAEAYKATFLARMWDVSAFMKLLKQRFTQWFNRRHRRKGTLWEERFKSVLVEGNHHVLATMAAYIDLNPVRAGLVEDPKDWRWCGYAEAMAGRRAALAGLGALDETLQETQAPEVLDEGTLRPRKAKPNRRQTLERYRVWLFGQGAQTEPGNAIPLTAESGSLPVEGQPRPRGSLAPERVAEVIAGEGKLTPWEMLRCRLRHFTDGAALGTRAWVDAVFRLRRGRFGPKRTSGARPIRQAEQGNTLHTLRDLRVRPVG